MSYIQFVNDFYYYIDTIDWHSKKLKKKSDI